MHDVSSEVTIISARGERRRKGLAACTSSIRRCSATSSAHSPAGRRVRPTAHLLGHRSHPDGVYVPRVRPTCSPSNYPWLAGADLEWVMGRGVGEWLGWPLPVS